VCITVVTIAPQLRRHDSVACSGKALGATCTHAHRTIHALAPHSYEVLVVVVFVVITKHDPPRGLLFMRLMRVPSFAVWRQHPTTALIPVIATIFVCQLLCTIPVFAPL
jgi:hypothetical protein